MYNSFITIVGIITHDEFLLKSFISKTQNILKENFEDFEIILINNGVIFDVDSTLKDLKYIQQDIRILNLSTSIDLNNAIVAGLDNANGDYVIVMDTDLSDDPDMITELYKKAQENHDIVYIRLKERKLPFVKMLLFRLFYYIMRKYSNLQIDLNMSDYRIISRRALNAVLQVRDKLRYMKGIYSFVGYKTSYIEIDSSLQSVSKKPTSYTQLFRTAISAITSFADIANKLLFYIFCGSLIFCAFAIVNALLVKLKGFDIFGNPAVQVQGWTFMMVFLSIMFTINSVILYLFSILLFSINQEIKDRPLYILESIKRLQDSKSSTNDGSPPN